MKKCSKCGVEKPLSEFSKASREKGGHRSNCKSCAAAYFQSLPRTEREARAQKTKTWRLKNPERKKASRRKCDLKKKYGITPEEFQQRLSSQGGVCAICQKLTVRMAVDHCHATGRIRGILCVNCNPGLGKFFDSPELLRRAAGYLSGLSNDFTGDAGC